jgi:6-pyruvoyltetrahydropterin/6-carboxytetrahydropterin synthase
MLTLTRAVDLFLDLKTGILQSGCSPSVSLDRLGVRIWITLTGSLERQSGLIVNVTEIDLAIRQGLETESFRPRDVPAILFRARSVITEALAECQLLRLSCQVGRDAELAIFAGDDEMLELTTRYELAASHRLVNPKWDQQRNVQVYGKCANPHGHGHNYTVEVTLRGQADEQSGQVADPDEVAKVVREMVIDRFDHKNLNEDTAEFAELPATVENMSRVFWDLLVGRFGRAKLTRIAVWETQKTRAEYFGPGAGPLRFSECV